MDMVDHERCKKQQLVMTCTLTLIPHIKTNVVFRHNRLVLFLDIDVLVYVILFEVMQRFGEMNITFLQLKV